MNGTEETGPVSVALTHGWALLSGQPELAREQAAEILKVAPGNREARLLEAAAFHQLGDFVRSGALFGAIQRDHKLWPLIEAAIREIYDPEIPVNIYELGLIYRVEITDRADGLADVNVQMTLTSPACPVAQEMPGWVQSALLPIDGIENVDVAIIWEPTWDPSKMAETAKLQLNMFT